MITATIYRNTRDDKYYVLDDMITQGEKVCLVPMDKRTDDKFVSPKTLKRWYTKVQEVPYIVEVKAFTGMKIGLFQAVKNAEGTLNVWTKDTSSWCLTPALTSSSMPRTPSSQTSSVAHTAGSSEPASHI